MEKRYKSLSVFEFQSIFPENKAYHKYLVEIKWKDGYKYKKN
jgi:hypothetical protein